MRKIQFSPPDISQEEIDEVVDTLRSGWITTGPKTKLFEKNIAEYCNTERAVCLNSATAGMELTLRMLGIGNGDEIITCAYTYSASASVIHHVGAKIVLVDTGKDSYHIDYDAIENAITPKTKVIIPVDIAGVMCDYDRIFEIIERKKEIYSVNNELQAKFNRIIVLADAAHSIGATYKGMRSGEVADFTVFSFHAVKNLTTAEGGAVVWRKNKNLDSDWIYRQYMLLALHGQTKEALVKNQLGDWEYDIIAPNYKCNMTDITASIGLVQLNRYPAILKRRREIIERYNDFFKEIDVSFLTHYTSIYQSCGHLYFLTLNNQGEEYRNILIKKLGLKGIAMNVHYKPLPLLTAYKKLGFKIEDFPNSLRMYRNEITLPLHTLLSNDDVHFICNSIVEVMEELKYV